MVSYQMCQIAPMNKKYMQRFKNGIIYLLAGFLSCTRPISSPELFLGQGIMAGEITDRSAILQTRVTRSDTLIEGDLEGEKAWVRFIWSTNPELHQDRQSGPWQETEASDDFIVRRLLQGLPPDTLIYYQAEFGRDTVQTRLSESGKFRTNPGPELAVPVSLVMVTGMNYYFHFYGNYDAGAQYTGPDRQLGFPALASINRLQPDYFVGTGDNVYFDHPSGRNFENAIKNGKNPLPGIFEGREVTDEKGMRQKYHAQFAQPRFKTLFRQTGTYWEKDDHDYRVNDGDPYTDFPISHELGIKNFREQLPVTDPDDPEAKTCRTIRMSKDLQLWFTENRDYRSANNDPDGPAKTIWGDEQKKWLLNTLKESDATYKCIISPTPMVGPDDAYKKDNHVNPEGFRYEGESFFQWLKDQGFSRQHLFIICGDRHWQYHSVHPTGFEEFSTGALVDANSRAGRVSGDPESTDPEGRIKQHYIQGTREQATGGFLWMEVLYEDQNPRLRFVFYDDLGKELYSVIK
jgi:alkaline phosphatase D